MKRSVPIPAMVCAMLMPALAADNPAVRVMTRNMDAGTDLNLVLGATDAASFAAGAAATLAEVKASSIPQRAARLAEEINEQQPDLIGLQEVTLWRTGSLSLQPTGASEVLYDQLDLLMSELAHRKLRYSVVVVQNLADVETPVPAENLNLRITDRDVILARADLKATDLELYNIQTHRFNVLLPLPMLGGMKVSRSWESVEVVLKGKRFRFVNTHLESVIPGVPATALIQLAQTKEMLDALANYDAPTVLVGDFNANAEAGADHTGAVEMVTGSGFKDAWAALNPGDPGYTWPLFGEDQYQGKALLPYERIDLIFANGMTPRSVARLSLGFIWGQAASDHAGVVATLEFD